MTHSSKLTPEFELLATKDNNNILTFPNDDYFFGKDGYIKTKYHNALKKLQKEKIIKLIWVHKEPKCSTEWVVII